MSDVVTVPHVFYDGGFRPGIADSGSVSAARLRRLGRTMYRKRRQTSGPLKRGGSAKWIEAWPVTVWPGPAWLRESGRG